MTPSCRNLGFSCVFFSRLFLPSHLCGFAFVTFLIFPSGLRFCLCLGLLLFLVFLLHDVFFARCQSVPAIFLGVCPGDLVSWTFPRHFPDISRTFPGHLLGGGPGMCPGFARYFARISPRFRPEISRTFPGDFPDIFPDISRDPNFALFLAHPSLSTKRPDLSRLALILFY